jgi:hypothetical protein
MTPTTTGNPAGEARGAPTLGDRINDLDSALAVAIGAAEAAYTLARAESHDQVALYYASLHLSGILGDLRAIRGRL